MNQPVFEQPAVQTAAHESAAYLSPRYAWYVVALLMLAYVFSFIDRQILNLLVGPIQRDLDNQRETPFNLPARCELPIAAAAPAGTSLAGVIER